MKKKPSKRASKPGVEELSTLQEPEFTRKIVFPLLEALGGKHITYVHGADEDGKDLVFTFTQLDTSDELHVCQVKNAPFSRRTGSSSDYDTVLAQLRKCKTHSVLHPVTQELRTPDRVWLIAGHPLPIQTLARAKTFLDDLQREGVKAIDGTRVRELLRQYCPDLYLKHCRCEAPFQQSALSIVNEHPERRIIDPAATGTVDELYVHVDVAPANGYFRRLVDHALRPIDVAVSTADPDGHAFVRAFAQGEKLRELHRRTRSGSAKPDQPTVTAGKVQDGLGDRDYRINLARPISLRVEELRNLYERTKTLDRPTQRRQQLAALLEDHRLFESAIGRLHAILGDKLFDADPTVDPATSFSMPHVTPLDLVSLDRSVLVRGDPGAGKTFHAKMAYKLAVDEGRPAIFFPCVALQAGDTNLAWRIQQYWSANCAARLGEIDKLLVLDGVVLVLDGMDEAGASVRVVESWLREALERNPNLRICVTCRSAFQFEPGDEFYSVELQGFTPSQLEQFFDKWFRGAKGKAASLLEFVAEHEAIAEAASSPLVASILAVLHQYDRDLPETYADLFEDRFEFLLDRWDKGRKIARNVYPKKDKRVFLERLAFATHAKRERLFRDDTMRAVFQEALGGLYGMDHLRPFVSELLVRNGVIMREVAGTYSFGHLAYQEYLAAKYIASRQRVRLLAEHFDDSWWRQVIKFYASITADVTRLVDRVSRTKEVGLLGYCDFVEELVRLARYTDPSLVQYVRDSELFSPDDATSM